MTSSDGLALFCSLSYDPIHGHLMVVDFVSGTSPECPFESKVYH